MTREELARNYSETYNVVDLDLRGEIERRTLGWYKKESDFERLIQTVIELVQIAAMHGYTDGYNSGIHYGFEKGRELVDDGLKDAPIQMQIIFKKISEQAAKDILEGLKYKSAEEVIKELDEEQI